MSKGGKEDKNGPWRERRHKMAEGKAANGKPKKKGWGNGSRNHRSLQSQKLYPIEQEGQGGKTNRIRKTGKDGQKAGNPTELTCEKKGGR